MLSIVTVVLNDASGLEATLRNIALQDFSDFEHIVIDGGSTDETLRVICACSRIDHWSSAPDDGIYDAMNKGLRAASGRWINFLNAGDSYLSTSALRDLRLETRDTDAIACPTLWKYVNGDEILVGVDQRWRDKLAMPTTHQSILYRTDFCARCHSIRNTGELPTIINCCGSRMLVESNTQMSRWLASAREGSRAAE